MRELPNLIYLQAFEAAARHLSFTRAADELNCTQAAISQRVRGLEHYFGRQLFKRSANGVELSSAGKAYLPSITGALDLAESATRGLTGRRQRRSVTLSAPLSFLGTWLAPRLPAFQALEPGIDIRLNSAIWTDPNLELADLSLSIAGPDVAVPGATTLWRERLVLVSTPGLGARIAAGEPLEALPQIEVQGRYPLWDLWADLSQRPRRPRQAAILVDTGLSAIDLAAAGAGIAVVYGTYARPALQAGRLVAPFGDGPATDHALTLQINPARRETAAVTAFAAWIRQAATESP
ncbi:LysR substrate-binding domain-containing protein [Frigidibacter sp. MR17.14]|uniref:LysR substrate-binding domain-containing protein n=1 Tax=Frigidibacter sp. MR17.14 TaxID=3126509 RepID=UPI0030130E07